MNALNAFAPREAEGHCRAQSRLPGCARREWGKNYYFERELT